MIRTALRTGISALILATVSFSTNAAQIAMETGGVNSVVGLMPQTMASFWAKDGVDVQLATGQTLTKSLLKVATGKLDSAVMPPLAFNALKKGVGPYKKMGDKASALGPNVRSLFGFPASYFHAITWADSGIDTWEDAAGKRIFIGPPAGAANRQIQAMIAAGGLAKDRYEGVKAPWNAAQQGFQDGQYDVYVGSYALGSQALVELSLSRKIRILPVKPENRDPDPSLGMASTVIPANTYPGQVNESDVIAWQSLMMLAVHKDMSDDMAYKMTKSYFAHTAEMGKNNKLLAHLDGADPFIGVTAPLHPGALRYYKENGISVPAALMLQ